MGIDRASLGIVGADQAAKQKSVMIKSRVVGRYVIEGERRGANGVENGRLQGRDGACVDVDVGETGFKVVVDVGVDMVTTDRTLTSTLFYLIALLPVTDRKGLEASGTC